MIERAIIEALERSRLGFETYPIFYNTIPESVPVAVMVDTPIPGFEIDPELPGYFNDMIEIVIRHNDPEAGINLCRKVMKVLEVRSLRIGGYHFNHIRPVSEPTAYPLSAAGNGEFAVRFEFSCYRVD